MPDLAALLDFAERPRIDDWSLRAALTRYAQGQPQRVGDLLQVVRRVQAVLPKEPSELASADGMVDVVQQLDALGDRLAAWATDPWVADRPDAEVDTTIAAVTAALDELGVPVEERPTRPSRTRSRG